MTRMSLFIALLLTNSLSYGLVGGKATKLYPSVFIWTDDASDLTSEYCSATKIGPTMFITAAHCVLRYEFINDHNRRSDWSHLPSMRPGQKIKLSFAKKITEHSKIEILTLRAIHYPRFLEQCLEEHHKQGCKNTRTPIPDVAVVEVEKQHLTKFYEAPIQDVALDTVKQGEQITMIGYGLQGEHDEEPPTLKAATQAAYTVWAMQRYLRGTHAMEDGLPDPHSFFGSPGILVNKQYANLGSGDSGGPVLNAAGQLVGINSDGYCLLSKPDCQRSTNSFFARIDDHANGSIGSWLRGVLASP